jgi:hypothetical protein
MLRTLSLTAASLTATLTLVAQTAMGLVIDDFSAGPAQSEPYSTESPGVEQLRRRQEALPGNSVLGGVRDLFFLHGGDSSVGEGVLRLNYDQSWFEVAILEYSRSGEVAPLNADFTADGSDHLFLRIDSAVYPEPPDEPAFITIGLTSREESIHRGSKFLSVPVVASESAYTIALPFESFDTIDLTDIDSIYFGFHLWQKFLTLEIDEIATGSLTPGDLNANGVIDTADAATYSQFYGATGPLAADANHDGVVNAADYTVWRDSMEASPATAVPEPGGMLLAALAIASRLRRLTPRA